MKQTSAYIGITGFMKEVEVMAMLDLMPRGSQRKLMVGVLMSWKTLNRLPNKWPNRYPDVNDVSRIFTDHPLALNLVHYNTKELATLHWQLEEITKSCGPNLHGLQLNIAWPDQTVLKMYKESHPDKILVLQIGSRAFELIGHSPERLAAKVLKGYKGLIDYVLLDPSGGYGIDFDPVEIAEYIDALTNFQQKARLKIGLGIAGGLSATTLRNISPLIAEFSGLSIDAEGRLRDSDDHLDLREAGEYISKASEMFLANGRRW